jgi:hypothetical protein
MKRSSGRAVRRGSVQVEPTRGLERINSTNQLKQNSSIIVM